METRNIFIDTSIFISQNYNFKSATFGNLCRLAKTNKARVYLTDINIREVRAHIEEDVSKAIQASSTFKKRAKILRNIESTPFKEFFQNIDDVIALESLYGQLDEFLTEVGATILQTSEVSIDAIFDKYFEKKPPFGDGKKKSEFPDAFIIEALEAWCEKKEDRIYVVSEDHDLCSHCNTSGKLIFLSKLAKFISLVEFHDEVLSPSVLSLVVQNRESIKKDISEAFCNEGFWIEDQDGDVNDVRVNNIEVEEMLLLKVDQNSAVLQVDVKTNFSADLTYDDLDTASYDSEDKILIPWRTIDKTVEENVEYTAIICISHDVDNPEHFDIDSVEIEAEQNFGFSVSSDDDGWPYK